MKEVDESEEDEMEGKEDPTAKITDCSRSLYRKYHNPASRR